MERGLREAVRERAGYRCEYCLMPEGYDVLPVEIDHIIARKHGGTTESGNLALSCYPCNAYKGPNIAGMDGETDEITRLFHPRRDIWQEHFEWSGGLLIGRTTVGRVTIRVLDINQEERVCLRQSLIREGVFPPTMDWR
jgi:hypothetical protein